MEIRCKGRGKWRYKRVENFYPLVIGRFCALRKWRISDSQDQGIQIEGQIGGLEEFFLDKIDRIFLCFVVRKRRCYSTVHRYPIERTIF